MPKPKIETLVISVSMIISWFYTLEQFPAKCSYLWLYNQYHSNYDAYVTKSQTYNCTDYPIQISTKVV